MPFRVDITERAQRDIDDLARYCRNYAEEEHVVNVLRIWNAARDPDQFQV